MTATTPRPARPTRLTPAQARALALLDAPRAYLSDGRIYVAGQRVASLRWRAEGALVRSGLVSRPTGGGYSGEAYVLNDAGRAYLAEVAR